METTNKHGLSRYIPSDVKLEIRKNSGFGCVICGLFIYEYEHIDPEFKNAKAHDPKNICLLCPTHHAKVTKGLISKDIIKEAYANPKSMQSGYVNDFEFAILRRPLTVRVGNIIFQNPSLVLKVDETNVIEIKDELPNNLLLNATFFDADGKVILKIVNNEWIAETSNWDIEVKSRELIIKNDLHNTILSVKIIPHQEIVFNNIKMFLPNGTSLDSYFDETKDTGFVRLITKQGIGVESPKITTGGYIHILKDNLVITGPTKYSGGRLGGIG